MSDTHADRPAVDPPLVDPRLADRALERHRRAAYEAGYARAIADVLTGSVFLAEQTLREPQRPAEARALLYRFVAKLEEEARRLGADANVVSDGLGI